MVGFPRVLCGLQHPSRSEQLEQVADRAHQSPLTADILLAAQAEAVEAASLLDLSEDRFNDRLAHLIDRASGLGSQLRWQWCLASTTLSGQRQP